MSTIAIVTSFIHKYIIYNMIFIPNNLQRYILASLTGRGRGVGLLPSKISWGMGLLLACFLMTSCGVMKSYERPSDLQTDGLYGSAQLGSSEQGLGAKAWREFFTDPTLQALIEKGLSQNVSMRQMDLQIQALHLQFC